jgi:hypothetical protein
MLEPKINKLRTIMQNSNNHYEVDMEMIRIQSLECVQGQIYRLLLLPNIKA